MTTGNEIWVNTGERLERLDLFEDTLLLPTFIVNNRLKVDNLNSSYSPEFSVPATAHNHRLLGHAFSSQAVAGQAYKKLPALLTSGGVEVLPNAILIIKGYMAGAYQLQLAAGNINFVQALGDKRLSDLDLSAFNHAWTPQAVLSGLSYEHLKNFGWGYELFDRGKAIDLQNIDPYDLYPSCSANLIFQQIVTDAGFTADDLTGEPLFAALVVPTAQAYTFPQNVRDVRRLQAGFAYNPVPASDSISDLRKVGRGHEGEFAPEKLVFTYASVAPYHKPEATTAATYVAGEYTADKLGYYDLAAAIPIRFGCIYTFPGQVSCKVILYINGQPVLDASGAELGKDEYRITDRGDGGGYLTRTFAPKLTRFLLHPGDKVTLWWQGDEYHTIGLSDPYWQFGPYGAQANLPGGFELATAIQFSVEMLPDFPPGGLVKLNEWLPDMKQSEFFQTMMALLGLTVAVDKYEPHLKLTPGNRTLQNIGKLNWTAKLDRAAPLGRIPERNLAYRLGDYAQKNILAWAEDERVTAGYGDGLLTVQDEILPASYEMAKLPFAATEVSRQVLGLLEIINFEPQDLTATPPTYSTVQAKPRLVLRGSGGAISGRLIMVPASPTAPAMLASFTTTASYFTSAGLSLELDKIVLPEYYADLRAALDQVRVLTERLRLTVQDVAELDFSVPVWLGGFNDYFLVSEVREFDPRRSVEVVLIRLNAAHLPAPTAGELREWYGGEFGGAGEWY